MNGPEPAADGRARVRVVRGAPDDVELAALVAGLVAASARSDETDEPATRSMWRDRARAMRGDPVRAAPGPDAWRWSLRG
ncbi:MAG TPA: acyl-CoA carboxylase epsilon subunit [Cellulomonas sp.]|uniref:acyl-CoA carboxylase epsilon subunit n=1 Tax=Cellulomonas sp. TaxID=40001 RepID=UPI002E340F23|nr:acyl-CoA carboxylase epsilon subunit [Cellulomonas sp.]HEX5331637.1 acyl-CoA carboxylase epsilon subunit [Cellulomonas sp.]